jgi:hypothetical protein
MSWGVFCPDGLLFQDALTFQSFDILNASLL